MTLRNGMALGFLAAQLLLAGPRCGPLMAGEDEQLLVTVNGEAITHSDLEWNWRLNGVPDEWREPLKAFTLERMIDEQLIAEFLKRRKVTASPIELDARLDQIRKRFAENETPLATLLAREGLSEEAVHAKLALPLAWKAYLRKVVTDEQLRSEFETHRSHYDGTRVTYRQLLLKPSAESLVDDATPLIDQATALRESIVSGEFAFDEAARKHSQSPTADAGGDMGSHRLRSRRYRSLVEQALIEAAFDLDINAVSKPIKTGAGVHLVQVTERHPGDESLEDARPTLLDVISKRLWDEQVELARRSAKIEWHEQPTE